LAALSPIALLWALPTFEAAVVAQFHGAARAPLSTVPHTVERSIYHLGLHRMWRERSRQGTPGGQLLLMQPGSAVFVRPPRNPQSPGGPPPRGPYPRPPGARPGTSEKEEVNARVV